MKYQIASVVAITSLITATPAWADSFQAQVVSVEHGSRLTVRTANNSEVTVQLACLDAPDLTQSPWGQTAINKLKQLAPRSASVNVTITNTDRDGRILGLVTLNGKSLNEQALRTGTAVLSEDYFDRRGLDCFEQRLDFRRAENAARRKKQGFWNQGCPIMPWIARKGMTKELLCDKPATFQPGTCQDLRERDIHGPFYRDEKDPNYTPARDPDRDGVACEGYFIDRTSNPVPVFR
jgi:micrococcal nuclease